MKTIDQLKLDHDSKKPTPTPDLNIHEDKQAFVLKKRASIIDPKKFESKLTLPLVTRMHTSSSKETSSPPKKASQAYLEPLKKYATICVDSVDGESTPNSP